jgi:predicted transcriptional regulator of viral defense system
MKFKEYITSHQAFTTNDLYAIAAKETVRTQLRRALKAGEVERVRRGTYVSKVGKFLGESPDPFLVTRTVDSEAIISYHSALVAHGVAHNVGFECSFRSTKVRSPFEYGGVRYAPFDFGDDPQTQTMRSKSYGAASITTREQTLVDCLSHPGRAGGVEEAVRSCSAFPYLNVEDLLEIIGRAPAAVVARALGYTVKKHPGGHAGRTFLLRYRGDWGVDHVKVDCIYMNRSPIMPPVVRKTPVRPGAKVRTFADAELAAGKVKAFFDRVKVRDLYDVSNLRGVYEALGPNEREKAHQLVLYYASLSACFPKPFEGRERRFSDRKAELEDQLYPMLRSSTERPTLAALMQDAERFITDWVLPKTDGEREYLERLADGDYRPELVFQNESMVNAAAVNPEALWKLENLRKMHR